MGNKLCAPLWKKPYRDGESPWYPKKDSHLLRRITAGFHKRLWAEIFKVTANEGELGWERVSEDVVPVNITCIQDNPGTVFQVTAYSRHVEKIFDTRLVQPGTRITQSSECFVHWKDVENNCEWGLNFTTALDARRFVDCCETYAHRVSARKATSSTSLRLSPPKKLRAKKATSAPNSPASKPRRTVSSPEDLASTNEPGTNNKHADYGPYDNIPGHGPVEGTATLPSRMRQQRTGNEAKFGDQVHLVNQPPSNVSVYDNLSATLPRKGVKVDNPALRTKYATRQHSDPTHVPPSTSDTFPRKSILKVKQDNFTQNPPSQVNNLSATRLGTLQSDLKSDRPPIAAKPIVAPKPAQLGEKCDKKPNGQIVKDSRKTGSGEVTKDLLPVSQRSHSHSSEGSPEWPAPPEPLSPCSPDVPVYNATFDSDTLKRMLQCLPLSPQDRNDYHDFEISHSNLDSPVTQSQPVSPMSAPSPTGPQFESKPVLQRTQSLRGRRDSKNLENIAHEIELEFPVDNPPDQEMQKKGDKSRDYDMRTLGVQARDSYPDSGISGMTYDTIQSMDSKKSATMPPGLGVLAQVKRKGSKGNHGSLGRHGTDQLDVRPYLPSSEISCDEDSDDEESDSSIHTLPSESQSAMAKRTGAIRKAG
ncbi:uncharacterized protein LOC135487831 [Lineus longissimus]|uniref:uncharacterized protein LOC135487831 n=1 Tax=Lineus longissimus TaxID=88925 RepID=UPI00315CDA02